MPKRMLRVFVDGQHGTTGLEIHRLLHARPELTLLELSEAEKKDPNVRRACLNEADAVVLCLPDDAAIDAVNMIDAPQVRVLDASSAHRVDPHWCYGLPELHGHRDALRGATRVSNPGCYPTGFLLAVEPLLRAGIVAASQPLSVHAVSGYSGGGRKLIDRFTARARSTQNPDELLHAQAYALNLEHKHLPEMRLFSGTAATPLFAPSVGHFYRGMLVFVPLFVAQLARPCAATDVVALWRENYAAEPCIEVFDPGAASALDEGYLDPQGANHTNRVQLMAYGNTERLLLVARLDNLGKGAAGAAVQNLNLMLGLPEFAGLAGFAS